MNLDVAIFCASMIQGAENWLQQSENTELYQKNYNTFVRRYPDGLLPYIVGVPVIT